MRLQARKTSKQERMNSPLSVKVDNVHGLELLKNVTSNTTTALAEMRWTASVPLASSIDPTEGTNSKTTPQVDFPCHGC